MRVNDQPAFLLRRRDFRDSSLILDLFTLNFGRISVLAKGGRKRRDSSVFQPFNRLSVGWTGNSELKTLTGIDAVTLPLPQQSYLAAFYINELLLYLLPPLDPYESVFRDYQQLLLQIQPDTLEPLLRNFEINLLNALGLMPELCHLADDGAELQAEACYRVNPDSGVLITGAEDPSSFSAACLQAIHQRRFDEPETLRAGRRLMRQIIDFNLNGRTLQSRKLYQQMVQRRRQ